MSQLPKASFRSIKLIRQGSVSIRYRIVITRIETSYG